MKMYVFYHCSNIRIFWITAQWVGIMEQYRDKITFLTFCILKYSVLSLGKKANLEYLTFVVPIP